MKIKLNYKQKLFLGFVPIFTLFTCGMVLFEQSREKHYKIEALREKLDSYAAVVYESILREGDLRTGVERVVALLPREIRLTLTDVTGKVLYDNVIADVSAMENHAARPEIADAKADGKGFDIRNSDSNTRKYLYHAVRSGKYFVRAALPYDARIRSFLESDHRFLAYVVALFLVMLALINFVVNRFGNTIKKLRDFTDSAGRDNVGDVSGFFPRDEQGEIAAKIAETYLRLKENEQALKREHEKLMQHVRASEEGLCFFTVDRKVEFYNGLFIRYLNIIIDDAGNDPTPVFADESFAGIAEFLDDGENDSGFFETTINKQGKIFAVRANVFADRSFEIIVNDITVKEKTVKLKQEMTGNITHELRTPVTGIRGCLETVLKHSLAPEKQRRFIENAYNQAIVLSELIQDIRLITETEEAPHSFRIEPVEIAAVLESIRQDLEIPLRDANIAMEWNFGNETVVNGNRHLLHSIFRNLTDNVIRHAGNNVRILINRYGEDENFFYFSYSDTGRGIADESHLERLFERFYRVCEGRSRETGGSGLGLSIVKKAVAFHKGSISVKNRTKGGLEFLFNLKK